MHEDWDYQKPKSIDLGELIYAMTPRKRTLVIRGKDGRLIGIVYKQIAWRRKFPFFAVNRCR